MKILKETLLVFGAAVLSCVALIGGYIIGLAIVIGIAALIHKILVKLFPKKFKKPEDDFIEMDDEIADMLLEHDEMQELIDKGDVIVEHVMLDNDEVDTIYYYNREKYRRND